jgi:uncharacterized protein
METILITGGTGLVGKHLTQLLLQKGHSVIVVSREKKTSNHNKVQYAQWQPHILKIDEQAIQAATVIINLAGAGVADKRWTNSRKKEILDSRVFAGQTISKALAAIPNNIHTVINASAIGWYGADDNNSSPFTEQATTASDFLGTTCKAWEESIQPVTNINKRLVIFRIGIVLSNKGGALAEFVKPLRMGIAAILGSGKQMISWVHITDLCNMFIHAINNPNMQGVYNAISANPVSNKTLTLSLATIMRGRFFIPIHVPSFLLKIILGEMSVEVLKSCTVSNEKIKLTGFSYQYNNIDVALKAEVKE